MLCDSVILTEALGRGEGSLIEQVAQQWALEGGQRPCRGRTGRKQHLGGAQAARSRQVSRSEALGLNPPPDPLGAGARAGARAPAGRA